MKVNLNLSEYARLNGVTYRTAWNHFKSGKIKGERTVTGGIVITQDKPSKPEYVITYSRVSNSENKENLLKQEERLKSFCNAKGWIVNESVSEIGSGLNDNRKKLRKILQDGIATKIVIEHKDRLTRFGFNYIETLCAHIDCEIIVINPPTNDKEDLIQDFISIITSFCARIYGQRRSRRQTEKIIKDLSND